ncbi:hypothetical protein QN399_26030, partial [Pseudomonas sp. 10C3]|uniref:hypothetical protein n=1 Tax=Pseudomonas sp. 10C3 TaxID=3118753 RepID=UPI002E801DBF
QLSSQKIKTDCNAIEDFIGGGDLCLSIVDIDVSRDRLKGSLLAAEVKDKALTFRKKNPPKKKKVFTK